jgi:hypothetical protein
MCGSAYTGGVCSSVDAKDIKVVFSEEESGVPGTVYCMLEIAVLMFRSLSAIGSFKSILNYFY